MDGVTGFNPDKFKEQVRYVYLEGTSALSSIYGETDKLFTELSKTWYSPNALAFDIEYRQYVLDLINNSAKVIIDFCKNAAAAYNVVAAANGYGPFSMDDACYECFSLAALKEVGPDGAVGMDLYRVKNAVNTFRLGIAFGLNKLVTIPSKIELYDPGSEQKKQYLATLAIIKEQISGDLYDMADKIKGYTETEINHVFRAANTSAEILRG